MLYYDPLQAWLLHVGVSPCRSLCRLFDAELTLYSPQCWNLKVAAVAVSFAFSFAQSYC